MNLINSLTEKEAATPLHLLVSQEPKKIKVRQEIRFSAVSLLAIFLIGTALGYLWSWAATEHREQLRIEHPTLFSGDN